ncbi:hypothetical protein [Peribacillus simplex]|uniref:hypothetical protein n=1 Tax=Peribacillus simplex TaxID=1478 RepID=UPI0036DBEAF8
MGVTEFLIIIDNEALIVSTKNNKVITVMDRDVATSQIFTNINGTIILINRLDLEQEAWTVE